MKVAGNQGYKKGQGDQVIKINKLNGQIKGIIRCFWLRGRLTQHENQDLIKINP